MNDTNSTGQPAALPGLAEATGSPFREGDVVWCVFADGVLGGIYAGSKTFPAKTPGKPDYVCHYVQLVGRDYSQFVNLEHVYSDLLEANKAFREYAKRMVAHLKAIAALDEENVADEQRRGKDSV